MFISVRSLTNSATSRSIIINIVDIIQNSLNNMLNNYAEKNNIMFKRLLLTSSALLILFAPLFHVSTVGSVSLNLVPNPSFETASSSTVPTSWGQGKWGTNTATFTYKTNEGHTGNKSALINMTKFTSGDAKWYFTHITIVPSKTYVFSDFYKSSVATEVDVEYKDAGGKTSYAMIAKPVASATSWQQVTATFTAPATAKTMTIFHVINKVGTLQIDDMSVMEQSAVPTAPIVSIGSPLANATISGTQAITANATDAVSVAGVQFAVDGVNLGAEDTTAPYGSQINTTTYANGIHTIRATARNASNLTSVATVSVNVQNIPVVVPVPTPVPNSNLIANPSIEQGTTSPLSWVSSSWGTNTTVFSYLSTGHTGTKSLKAETSAYSSGAANWYYVGVPAVAGKAYMYENWYQSDVTTEVDAEVTMQDGTVQYFYVGSVPASSTWAKFSSSFTAPANTKAVAIYQILAKKGYVITDDYSLTEYIPAQFTRGLVSLTFDDGWKSISTNGFPLLSKYGLTSTQYLNSQPIVDGYPDYMTAQQVKDFYAAGHELAWHTRTHADITQLSAPALATELSIPADFLASINLPATAFTNFASPFGAYNTVSVAAVRNTYRSHRSTDVGYNTKDQFDVNNIKVQNITNTTTPTDVQAWVSKALAEKTWLVIVYHEVDTAPADTTYAVTPTNLDLELNAIKQSSITVKTVEQALNEIAIQP
jgi:peptidoglycan/xylan/chitin deacetylase (PgdA/CDA1 family)